jgi:hypothetical protein
MTSPLAVGIGAGVVAAAGLGYGAYQITDGIGERHPNGSEADGKARLVNYGLIGLGIASAVGGFFVGGRGFNTSMLGAAMIGGGIGAVVGGIGSGIGFTHKHGIGVETQVNDIFGSYNRDFDSELDLDTTWRTPEDIRREETRHTDSDGNYTYSTYTYYSIQELANLADTNHDYKVTKDELRTAVARYDFDGNQRLQPDENKRFDREVGERSWYGSWF